MTNNSKKAFVTIIATSIITLANLITWPILLWALINEPHWFSPRLIITFYSWPVILITTFIGALLIGIAYLRNESSQSLRHKLTLYSMVSTTVYTIIFFWVM